MMKKSLMLTLCCFMLLAAIPATAAPAADTAGHGTVAVTNLVNGWLAPVLSIARLVLPGKDGDAQATSSQPIHLDDVQQLRPERIGNKSTVVSH